MWAKRGGGREYKEWDQLVVYNQIMSELTGRSNDGGWTLGAAEKALAHTDVNTRTFFFWFVKQENIFL